MRLSLTEHNAITGLADILYNFLSGSGHQSWRGYVTFASMSDKVGTGHHWPNENKGPAIIALLSQTLERERSRFEPLSYKIDVQEVMAFRSAQPAGKARDHPRHVIA